MGFGQQFLELGVLALKLTQALGLRDLHAAKLGTPFVKRGLAEAAAAAQLGDAHAGLCLSQEANDLFVAEPALLHVRHSPGLTDFSRLPWYGWRGAGQLIRTPTCAMC
jgi:hypothetical protein